MLDAENMERKPIGTVCHLHTVFFSIKSKMIHFEGTLKRRDFPSVGLAPKELLSVMGCQEQRWHLSTSRTEPLNSPSRDADAAVSGDAERAGEIQGDLRPKQ